MMICRGYHFIVLYLDDFLIIGNSKDECYATYDCLACLLLGLGLQVIETNVGPPTQCITFLGVEINSLTMTLPLPTDKLSTFEKPSLIF